MRLIHIAFHIGAVALSMIASAASAAVMAIDRFVDAVLSIMPVEKPRLAFDSPGLAMNIGGQALDPALRQQMRHESRTARIGAERHT